VESQLQEGDSWLILSAKHGLLTPTQRVAPYDQSLDDMTPHQRSEWARAIYFGGLLAYLEAEAIVRIVFLAGSNYQRRLRRLLLERKAVRVIVEDPLHGLEIGQRLQWLKANTPAQQGVA
jgi:hypothetical protein